MFRKFKEFINQQTLLGEILRFVFVGGVATVIDFLFMGITLYIFAPENYPNFFNVFFGAKVSPTALAAAVSTGVGFLFGLTSNYILSVLFVFNEKGKSKTVKGFLVFCLFSLGGLLIQEVGMWLLFGKIGVNEWIVKILMTLVVLVYNYVTRKIFIFRKKVEKC